MNRENRMTVGDGMRIGFGIMIVNAIVLGVVGVLVLAAIIFLGGSIGMAQ